MYIELYGSPDSEKQDKNIPDKIHLRVRHLSGSHFLAGDNKMKTYRQPVTDFRDFKFDRFTISNEGKCRKAKQEGRISCKPELLEIIYIWFFRSNLAVLTLGHTRGEGWLSQRPPPPASEAVLSFFFSKTIKHQHLTFLVAVSLFLAHILRQV